MASGFPIAVVLEDQLRLDDQPSFREAVSWPSSAMAVDRAGLPVCRSAAAGPQSAAWRTALLRQFLVEDLPLDRVHQPALILASGRIDS